MALLVQGYWPTTYWPSSYWIADYWPEFKQRLYHTHEIFIVEIPKVEFVDIEEEEVIFE